MSTVETDETADERRRRKKKEYDKQYLAANREKILEGKRAWRIANPDKVRNQGREWAIKNPDKVKLKREKYNAKNAEKNLERARAYRAANREKVRESTRKWCATNAEKVRQAQREYYYENRIKALAWGAKTRARKLNIEYALDEEWIRARSNIDRCEASGVSLDFTRTERQNRKKPFAPSLERVNPKLGYTCGNTIVVCNMYNMCKNEFTEADVAAFCLAYVTHNKLITPAKESEMRRPRLIILAPGRWGKDTAAEYLRDKYGLTFRSSSEFVGRKAVFPYCQPKVTQEFTGHPEYKTFEECFADRHNHRALWHDLISKYNRYDAARLGRELFAEYDMYVGLRSRREFDALKAEKAFDHVIWIDASKRHPPESSASMSIDASVADHIIDNNGTLQDLHRNLDNLMHQLSVSALTEIDAKCK